MSPSARAERGAVLIEAAIAIPLLIFLIFGGIELGMAWEARSATTSGVRTGLLRSASMGDRPGADLRTLQSVVGEIGPENVDGIEWIVIFNADTPDAGARIAQCAATAGAGGGRGLDNLCAAYDTADLQAIVAGTATISNFDSGGNGDDTSYNCDSSKWDQRFCSGSRLLTGAINIGVALEYNHEWITGALPSDGVTYTEYAVSSTLNGEQADPAAPVKILTNFMSAEDATKSGAFASDGTGWGVFNGTSQPNSKIVFEFSVSEPGYYLMQGSIRAPGGADDSFWVKLNDDPDTWLWDTGWSNDYRDRTVGHRYGPKPVRVWLEPGTHTVTLFQREDGTFVESMQLIKD